MKRFRCFIYFIVILFISSMVTPFISHQSASIVPCGGTNLVFSSLVYNGGNGFLLSFPPINAMGGGVDCFTYTPEDSNGNITSPANGTGTATADTIDLSDPSLAGGNAKLQYSYIIDFFTASTINTIGAQTNYTVTANGQVIDSNTESFSAVGPFDKQIPRSFEIDLTPFIGQKSVQIAFNFEQIVVDSGMQAFGGAQVELYDLTAQVCTTSRNVAIVFNESGVPLSNGKPPNKSPAFINSVKMQAIPQGVVAGGTYKWSTDSDKVTLSNVTFDPVNVTSTVTVTSVAESTSTNDVDIKVTYTVNGKDYTAHQLTTVQKPTFFDFSAVTFNGNCCISAMEMCKAGRSGWEKDITWQVTDKWHNPIRFALPNYDTITGAESGKKGNLCHLNFTGTNPGPTLGGSGLWDHMYSICSTQCFAGNKQGNPACVTTAIQHYFCNGFQVDLTIIYKCDSITVDGN